MLGPESVSTTHPREPYFCANQATRPRCRRYKRVIRRTSTQRCARSFRAFSGSGVLGMDVGLAHARRHPGSHPALELLRGSRRRVTKSTKNMLLKRAWRWVGPLPSGVCDKWAASIASATTAKSQDTRNTKAHGRIRTTCAVWPIMPLTDRAVTSAPIASASNKLRPDSMSKR